MDCRFVLIMSLIVASIGPSMVRAATVTTTFQVSATVLGSCAVSATSLAFGNYDQAAVTPLDATNTVTVNCTIGTVYNIGLGAGGGTGATVDIRKMSTGANTLDYTIYKETGRTTVWGNTVSTNTISATALVTPTVHTAYGRVSTGQNVPAGTYTDTITVTVNY